MHQNMMIIKPQNSKNLSSGPPPSSQWGNHISWWLAGDLEQLKSSVKDLSGKMFKVLPCLSQRRSKPYRSTQKEKKIPKVYFKMETIYLCHNIILNTKWNNTCKLLNRIFPISCRFDIDIWRYQMHHVKCPLKFCNG